MNRVVHKADNFDQADKWDIRQQVAMTPAERMRIGRTLKERAYPGPVKDIRAWHRDR